MGLLQAMQEHKGQRNLTLYWDIETLAYNKIAGRQKPTHYKNVVYSVAIGWDNKGVIDVEVFPSFKSFFDTFFDYADRKDTITKSRTTVSMIAHNCNKYDNHFLLHDVKYLYSDLKVENLFMKNAEENANTVNMKEAKMDSKEHNIVLEKRVKSSINLDLILYLKGFKFVIVDNFMKTTTSIAVLGKKLRASGYVTDEQLKTDFEYDIFDIEDDMTDRQAYDYALKCFTQLDKDQMTYIHNDVIILGQSHIHYSDIFPNFDYSKMTFSVNIMNSYLNNEHTRFQLLNERYVDGEKMEFNYTNYQFFDMNYYDYIKGFYRGGLNMYNPKYVAKMIEEPCFSIDINSSYPYVMYHEKIPTWLADFDEFEVETEIDTDLDNYDSFTLFKMDKTSFNVDILYRIESTIIRQMLVKYYSNNEDDYVNINTNTLRLIEDLTGIDCSHIYCMSYVSYDCEYFGARDIIFENYFIKTQGKLKTKINMADPFNYEITDIKNDRVYSQEEINLSKVILNGLYGIPALRSHFNLFRLDGDGFLQNFINGYKNNERNILFSTFVTSQSLYNLLEPLQYLSQSEIDENFIYCDTDSLYLKSTVKNHIPDSLFDPISLGKWDIENDLIDKMYVLNHKKYAYVSEGEIHVASAGIPQNAFNMDQAFESFIENDFYDGAVIYNNKSIYNEQGTISIYPSKTNIDKGENYPTEFNDIVDEKRKALLERVREEYNHEESEDFIYIESEVGTFSARDIFPVKYPLQENNNLNILKTSQDMLKQMIN